VPKRRLFLLRNERWPSGPKTTATVNDFHGRGGRTLPLSLDDLRTFEALRIMRSEQDGRLTAWLADRRPASSTGLFRAALGLGVGRLSEGAPAHGPAVGHAPAPGPAGGQPEARPADQSPPAAGTVRLGAVVGDGRPYDLELAALRKHTVIFAGSGSGKTVLIRRLVEECALRGVSAIVLDPNNDLARLGEAWPAPPGGWGPGDAEAARDLLADTEVVVWTPGLEGGRPLTFQPLPNFEAVRADPDEFRAAIDVAVGALAPRARVEGTSAKAMQGQAVLRDALSYYARQGESGGLRAFVAILAELPEGVTQIGRGNKLAADMADTLTAAMVNDPLFGGTGTAVDPGVLLVPQPHKRARISVISMVGLGSEEQRQSFVNQLQMALFAWIKRHPAGDRPLGGLLVMDEAQTLAPSSGATACTASTLALVAQARKYGLGLVFATQAPRGLHNQIPGNAATQFFGLLGAPVQIAAAVQMAQARGGSLPEIGLLTAGTFYTATEGRPFEKVVTPMCLTHHPAAPLTPDEVIARANTYPGA
jgi:hypothetical protein